MTILFITENLGSGGAERQLTRLAAYCQHQGHKAIVVTWVNHNFHDGYLRENNVEHILLPPKNKVDRVLKVASLMRERKADAAISYLPMSNETAILARLLSPKTKLIVSERSFTTSWSRRRQLTNFLYRFADHIVANSNNEAKNIIEHCPALKSKTVAIPNSVELDVFQMKQEHKYHKPVRLVGVGRIIPSKNIVRLLEAIKKVIESGYDVQLNWYGAPLDKNYLKEIEGTTKRLGIAEKCLFHGECQNIQQAYTDNDIFVMPSLLEGYPNVMVEAMACGLPVAASTVCEHPFIIKDGENGALFNPHDTDAIADAIIHLLELPQSRLEKICRFNRNWVENNNSIRSLYDKYMELL